MADVCADLNHNTLEYLPLSDVMVCVTFRFNGTHSITACITEHSSETQPPSVRLSLSDCRETLFTLALFLHAGGFS